MRPWLGHAVAPARAQQRGQPVATHALAQVVILKRHNTEDNEFACRRAIAVAQTTVSLFFLLALQATVASHTQRLERHKKRHSGGIVAMRYTHNCQKGFKHTVSQRRMVDGADAGRSASQLRVQRQCQQKRRLRLRGVQRQCRGQSGGESAVRTG